MKIETLHEAFVYELSDMHNAEKQLTAALEKMADAASDPELVQAFSSHLEETEGQIALLDRVAEICDLKFKRETCEAMEGLVKEAKEVMSSCEKGAVRDAMLITAAQKVEHYEIASYGSLVALAKKLEYSSAADLLLQILDQEKGADRKLNTLAEQGINDQALRKAA